MRTADKKLGYDWRPDGNFLIRVNCVDCEKEFDEHALAPYTALCFDCKRAQMYAAQMEREYQDILTAQEAPKPFIVGRKHSLVPSWFWPTLSVAILTALGLCWKMGIL